MSKKRATTVRIATSRIQIRGKETFPDYESTENHLSRRDSGATRIYAKGPLLLGGRDLYVYIETFGCQQNEADSERLCGMAVEMGYTPTTNPAEADLILINTCAVRDEFLQGWGKKNLPHNGGDAQR